MKAFTDTQCTKAEAQIRALSSLNLTEFPLLFGIDTRLGYLCRYIQRGIYKENDGQEFWLKFFKAVPEDTDTTHVLHQFMSWLIGDPVQGMFAYHSDPVVLEVYKILKHTEAGNQVPLDTWKKAISKGQEVLSKRTSTEYSTAFKATEAAVLAAMGIFDSTYPDVHLWDYHAEWAVESSIEAAIEVMTNDGWWKKAFFIAIEGMDESSIVLQSKFEIFQLLEVVLFRLLKESSSKNQNSKEFALNLDYKKNGMLAFQYCDEVLPLKVLRSAAGYYIGTEKIDEDLGILVPCSRESYSYYPTKDRALEALIVGNFTQKKTH